MIPRALLAASLLVVAGNSAAAQALPGADRPPVRQAISLNPIFIPFGGLVAEYEVATTPGVTLGLSGGYYDPVGGDDETYSSAEAKVRFYPGENGPRGFSIGVSVGFGRTTDVECCTPGGAGEERTRTGATSGVVIDYNWLIGPRRRFFVGTGIGAKRLFGDLGEGDILDIEVLPTARLQVGAAF